MFNLETPVFQILMILLTVDFRAILVNDVMDDDALSVAPFDAEYGKGTLLVHVMSVKD